MPRFLVIIGTRPEAIKMAPVILALRSRPNAFVRICLSGQHDRSMAAALGAFGLAADRDLGTMRPGQTLTALSARIMEGVDREIRFHAPDMVLVHGDTTTTASACIASFHAKVPLAHVEAGLRTRDLRQPWPEEANRRIAGLLSSLHFAPTESARENLLREQVPAGSIDVTGNTGIDALRHARSLIERTPGATDIPDKIPEDGRHIVLVTGHRRENHGSGIDALCTALLELAARGDSRIVYPVHPNPSVDGPVRARLGACPLVTLLPPLDYLPFVHLMMRARVILTDSGGIQEEAPYLGTPVLLMRDVTERPEALECGAVKLIGMDRERIVSEASRLLESDEAYSAMSGRGSPFGDGFASDRIARRCSQEVGGA